MSTSEFLSDENTIEVLRNRVEELEELEKKLRERIDMATHEGDLLHALMDNIPDSIYFKDKNSHFISVNKAWASRRNLNDPSNAVGKSDFDYFSESFAQHTYEAEMQIMATCNSQEAKLERLEIDGENRWYTSTKVPVKNKNGFVIGTCGITRDITDLKKIEEELEKTNQKLEIRVQERTAELKKANQQLELQIHQLNFLYHSSFTLAQSMCQGNVFSTILDAFKPCLPKMQGCICETPLKGPISIESSTNGFENESTLSFVNEVLNHFSNELHNEPILICNWKKDPFLGSFQWPVSADNTCFVLMPLRADEKMISFMIVFTTDDFAKRYKQEKSVVMTLSTISAVVQKNALYYEELQKSARLEGELTAARTIQKKLIPQSKFSLPQIEIYGYYLPAYEVGGDYLDYFVNEEGCVIIAIGDVCGKGAPASMHMSMLRTTLRIKARNETSAKHLICEVNDSIQCDLNTLSFISLLCIIVNKDRTELSYARAGHPFLLQYSNSSVSKPKIIECSGIALGLIGDSTPLDSFLDEIKIPLKKGDRFFLYTDGLVEAVDASGQNYGIQRTIDILKETAATIPEETIESVVKNVDAFKNGVPNRDDLTLCSFSIV